MRCVPKRHTFTVLVLFTWQELVENAATGGGDVMLNYEEETEKIPAKPGS